MKRLVLSLISLLRFDEFTKAAESVLSFEITSRALFLGWLSAVGTKSALFLLAGMTGLMAVATPSEAAQTFKVVLRFNGGNGAQPWAALIRDNQDNLYGTTVGGGDYGVGVVFKLHHGKETVLHSFGSVSGDGEFPETSLVRDGAENLYGSTSGEDGHDRVFKFGADGHYSILLDHGSEDLTIDSAGNLYGSWANEVFKVDPDGKESVLYTFADGINVNGDLVVLRGGNIYGTTYQGGTYGRGTIFKLSKSGKLTSLYTFTGGTDGGFPMAGMIRDKAGNLYGTTSAGGEKCLHNSDGCGTVFKLAIGGHLSVLYKFKGLPDGNGPLGRLVMDASGNFYGTTEYGGFACRNYVKNGCGTVFKIDDAGKETILHRFKGGDGASIRAGLLLNPKGNLYGTAVEGNSTFGTVFKLIQ